MVPVDEDFGIVIPKINANARVIADVDWQDAQVYQEALTRGIAQAVGQPYPEKPEIFFFFLIRALTFWRQTAIMLCSI